MVRFHVQKVTSTIKLEAEKEVVASAWEEGQAGWELYVEGVKNVSSANITSLLEMNSGNCHLAT